MKEKLTGLIKETYPEFSTPEDKTKAFLDTYKLLAEIFERDFEHAWQIIIKKPHGTA